MLSELLKLKMIARFDFYDVDNTGMLEVSDYEALVSRIARARKLDRDCDEYKLLRQRLMQEWEVLQKHADTSSDQRVSIIEWLAFCEKCVSNRAIYEVVVVEQVNALFETFAAFDRDLEGAVSIDEFVAYYDAYGQDVESARKYFHIVTKGAPHMSKQRLLEIMEEFHFSEDPQAPGNYMWGEF